jgi:hypothetical protein
MTLEGNADIDLLNQLVTTDEPIQPINLYDNT